GAITGDASGDDYARKIKSPCQLLAGIIKPARQFHAAVLPINHAFDAVERVAFGNAVADAAAVGDLAPVVPVPIVIQVHHPAAGRRDQVAVVFNAELSFGEDPDLAFDLFARPGDHAGKALLLKRNEPLIVVDRDETLLQVPLEFLKVDGFHVSAVPPCQVTGI